MKRFLIPMSLLAGLAACAQTPPAASFNPVTTDRLIGVWQLNTVDSVDHSHRRLTANFRSDGTLIAGLGCNQLRTNWSWKDRSIVISGPRAITERGCTPTLPDDQHLAKAWSGTLTIDELTATRLALRGSSLIVLSRD